MSKADENEIPAEVMALIDELKRKAWLYGKMADELRAEAAKLSYQTRFPGKIRNTPKSGNDT